MGYQCTLSVIDDDGRKIVDVSLSSEETIQALSHLIAPRTEEQGLEESSTPRVEKKGGRKCSVCSRPGHTVVTCRKGKGLHPMNKEPRLDSELMQHAARQHPHTKAIEDMLIEGMGVPAIMEKVEVSAPTIYVIKSRLKKEGRLPIFVRE